jgi:hypothetical protein
MDGSADIARETQDLRVVVVPEINAGTAALVAVAINPAIGMGTFLAQILLRKPLAAAANTQEFQIEGTWADPKHRQGAAHAATAQPARRARPVRQPRKKARKRRLHAMKDRSHPDGVGHPACEANLARAHDLLAEAAAAGLPSSPCCPSISA